MLPGAVYRDPQLSFKYVVPPAALGFVEGDGLGSEFEGEMFLGSADLDPGQTGAAAPSPQGSTLFACACPARAASMRIIPAR
jgi:hypothetical protein